MNPNTTRAHIRGAVHAPASLFGCCVDLGYSALNTQGNAVETGQWARDNGFRSLIVVTSGYHMPRTIVELSRAAPDIELVPHPVAAAGTDYQGWWRDRRTAAVMTKEYVKYLLALVRIRLRAANIEGLPLSIGKAG